MAHPALTTEWPTGADLRSWLSENAVGITVDITLVDDMIDDASASIYQTIDPTKLPEDENQCPRTVARAIVLEAARILFRRQSPHGMAAFGDVALRLRTADVDVDRLIQPYMLETEP